MKILIAPNCFKESLNSIEIAESIAIGLKRASKEFEVNKLPLADGGTGTVAILTKALEGEFVKVNATGPLNTQISATYGIVPRKRIAIIELAEVAGLRLVPKSKRNPLTTTTTGVGELLLQAVKRGMTRIILGIGDSATIDCGVGALSVLGVRFIDKSNKAIEPHCKGLLELSKIDTANLCPTIKNVKIVIAADVKNKLTGKKGAMVYARQKGAKTKMIPVINRALKNFKKVILRQYGVDLDIIPGSGAAGGIGGAMKIILNAEIMSGFGIVKEMVSLEDAIKMNDLVITGEGKIDEKSFYGKTTKYLVDIAYRNDKPVILIAGSMSRNAKRLKKYGVIGFHSLVKQSISLKNALKNTSQLLRNIAYHIGIQIKKYDLTKKVPLK